MNIHQLNDYTLGGVCTRGSEERQHSCWGELKADSVLLQLFDNVDSL